MRRWIGVILALLAVAPGASADDPRLTLGRFTTTFLHDDEHKARAFNVELAAEAIDNKTIGPGATFSFNDAVGERTAAFGFAKSVVLRDGMIAEGMGGGACQVASTLHAAALLAGLDVVARAPHSRPSAYIRMGLDATVAFGSIDLKVRNPTGVPLVVHARAAKGTLDVWLDAAGGKRPTVSLRSEIVEHTLPVRQFERDPSIVDEKAHLKAFGVPGFRVRRTREIRGEDGDVRRDVRFDTYPVYNEILRVGPALDGARLGDEADGGARPVTIIDPGAVRPALVQLRPSTTVVLDNGPTSP